MNLSAIIEHKNFWYVLIIILLAPALLINLGYMTLIDDEALRALVAMDMTFSGNYITPKINGVFYYNKPPLYNWILLLFFHLTGEISEWSVRFPTVVFLLSYGASIFYFFKKHFSTKIAFLNALVFITCGRVLLWDSMLGLIDICFSWLMFLLFMVVYHQFQKKKFYSLFLLTYLLTAMGFMMKGLPAIVFQGTTLLVYFIYKKEFKRLFSGAHILGGLLFLTIIGTYYAIYHQYNSLENVFTTLLNESSKRTVTNYGIEKTLLHLLTFPFEMVYHFLPWSLFIVYFLKKEAKTWLFAHDFIKYCSLTFLANVLVYWSSPEVYPRYLLMLAPLIFGVFVYLHFEHKKLNTLHFRILDKLLVGLTILVSSSSFSPFFLKEVHFVPYWMLKTIVLNVALIFLTYAIWKNKKDRLLIFVAVLLVFRIGFNCFVIPHRNANDWGDEVRQSSIEVGQLTKDQPLFLYNKMEVQSTNLFYMLKERKAIIPRTKQLKDNAFYIYHPPKQGKYFEEKVKLKFREGRAIYGVGVSKPSAVDRMK